MMHSNRASKNAPPFEMPKPHHIHHRALLWDTVYCDLSLTQSLPWLHLRAVLSTLQASVFDPRDPPLTMPKKANADVSPELHRTGAREKQQGMMFPANI